MYPENTQNRPLTGDLTEVSDRRYQVLCGSLREEKCVTKLKVLELDESKQDASSKQGELTMGANDLGQQ